MSDEIPSNSDEGRVDDAALARVAMSRVEYEQLLRILGREPSPVELGMVAALWSEHCGYKHSRPLFHHFPTEGSRVLTRAGEENAGAIDIGDGWVAVFKMESHNHPSAIEPYQGAATGVGGILRDIFAMGMRPVALLDSLRFGPLDDRHNRHLFTGVVAGVGGYGNCIGVPTVGGEVQFDSGYTGNPLVNVMCVGVGRREQLLSASASGVGNPLVLVGADTGRDGIHGATFASVELDEDMGAQRPAVQVGNPFMEKLLMEACVELAERHPEWIEGLQDLGAAGLTSSSVEAAERAGTGISIDVELVPRRERGMGAYEVMLSESQERMLVIPKREHLDDVLALMRRWELHADVIGEVTDDGFATVKANGVIEARIPIGVLTDPPQYPPEAERPEGLELLWADALGALPDLIDANAVLLELLGAPNIASRRWIYRQYDHQVLNGTVVLPGGDAAVIRIPGVHVGLAMATDCNARFVSLDPRIGAAMAVAEAARNVVATGAQPVALTDCLNFGNPERPEVAYQLEQAVIGISEAARVLDTPVISGNASLYNETPSGAVLPTPTIGMLGVLPEVDRHLTVAPMPGDTLVLLGALVAQEVDTLAGSEYLVQAHGRVSGRPRIDLKFERAVQQLVLDAHEATLLTAAHDLADGGLAVALAECCLASRAFGDNEWDAGQLPPDDTGVGFVGSTAVDMGPRIDAALFGEAPSRFLVGVADEEALVMLLDRARDAGVSGTVLGRCVLESTPRLRLGPLDVSLDTLRDAYEGGLQRVLGDVGSGTAERTE